MGADQSSLTGDMALSRCNCRIVVVGPKSGDLALLALAHLPEGARIIGTGNTLEEIRKDGDLYSEANVLLNVTGSAQRLSDIIDDLPFLVWVHSITAGVDHLLCDEIVHNPDVKLTNAKGVFSSSLAEFVLFSCSYFAKDLPRLHRQQRTHTWEQFPVKELRGATMGIVGYGSIGQACARLAKVYGMRILALRRNPDNSRSDCNIDHVYGTDELSTLMSESDYLVICMALTEETAGMIREEHFKASKKGLVLINVGRGALLDEEALIRALQSGDVAGAALDVFAVEPLPEESPLWALPNVLISPHTADITEDSRYSSVKFFTEQCRRFLGGQQLECVVNKDAGY
ncbi:D-isomer specific 2-hydroxyacid dehydrogenase [Ochromonadaceae sp. CCMP2298]|nr:D-isomer specific 2-hydroxyacid dehydrogenase [Ochromonadaceae sp. CCMP2298]|mmetsp:Transcript_27615/g.61881  ORF Transcript_27615/g.61881 Transcript_27615/m.61881 type:complete len:344 (+) Transcript_27615:121-1152(+)